MQIKGIKVEWTQTFEHHCNLRGIGKRLEQPNFNLEWLHRSFSYVTSTLWNNLPVQIRESKNIKFFKNAVSKHTF